MPFLRQIAQLVIGLVFSTNSRFNKYICRQTGQQRTQIALKNAKTGSQPGAHAIEQEQERASANIC